jgi:hypothetical protein
MGILDALDFERGSLSLGTAAADSLEKGLDRGALRPLAARSRREGVGATDRSDVRNPEFAVNHSVIQRALAGRQPLAVPDCLLQPTPETQEQHRAVLCQPLDLAPRLKGILYLDRGLGGGGTGEAGPWLLEEFADRWAGPARPASPRSSSGSGHAPRPARRRTRDERARSSGEENRAGGDPSFHGIIARREAPEDFRVIEKVKDSTRTSASRGERHRQGAPGAPDSRPEHPERQAAHRRELRRNAENLLERSSSAT